MEKTTNKDNEKAINFKVPLGIKIISFIHTTEANFSESAYKICCMLKGGKFERRQASRANACILVTKRSSHLFATLVIFLSTILRPFEGLVYEFKNLFFHSPQKGSYLIVTHLCNLELEVYELNCPAESSYGQGQREHSFAFKKKENCVMCGRCFEIRESDKKIVGKF